MSIQEAVWRVLRNRHLEGRSVACVLSNKLAILIRDEGYRHADAQDWMPDFNVIRSAAAREAEVTIHALEQGDDCRLYALHSRLSTMADCVPWDNLARALSTLSPTQHAIIHRLGGDRSYKQVACDLSMKVKAVARMDLQARHQVDNFLKQGFAVNQPEFE